MKLWHSIFCKCYKNAQVIESSPDAREHPFYLGGARPVRCFWLALHRPNKKIGKAAGNQLDVKPDDGLQKKIEPLLLDFFI